MNRNFLFEFLSFLLYSWEINTRKTNSVCGNYKGKRLSCQNTIKMIFVILFGSCFGLDCFACSGSLREQVECQNSEILSCDNDQKTGF